MQKRTTKIGVFTKKELKTPEGKKLYKALYRINHPKTGSKPAQDPEKLRIIGEMDLFPKPTAESEARTLAAFEKESEKARQIHDALVRLVEMLKSKDKAHLAESVDGFLLRLKDGDGGEPLVFDALLLGAELGADTDTGNMLSDLRDGQRRIADELARANEQTALALRYAKTMEDAARDATDRPDRVGGEIVRMVWDQLERKEKDIALRLQQNNGNMNQTADTKNNFSAVRRCRERLRLLYAGARMALPAWLWNRDEIEEHKRKQDANPGWITPSGDFVRTNPNDSEDVNNF